MHEGEDSMKQLKPEEERRLKKLWQKMKWQTFDGWREAMNRAQTVAFNISEKQHLEAADVTLTPKQRNAFYTQLDKIRELWDGIDTVLIEEIPIDEVFDQDIIILRRKLLAYERAVNEIIQEADVLPLGYRTAVSCILSQYGLLPSSNSSQENSPGQKDFS